MSLSVTHEWVGHTLVTEGKTLVTEEKTLGIEYKIGHASDKKANGLSEAQPAACRA